MGLRAEPVTLSVRVTFSACSPRRRYARDATQVLVTKLVPTATETTTAAMRMWDRSISPPSSNRAGSGEGGRATCSLPPSTPAEREYGTELSFIQQKA